MSQLNVYKASAGSGKTFRLVLEYLKLVIANPFAYRNILAVTFTNKATAEMKERILRELHGIAKGERTGMLVQVIKETGIDQGKAVINARKALSGILHNYSRFNISTIDTFVQRVIQSLLWEMGLKGGFELELDNALVLERSVDIMLDESPGNSPLFKWLSMMGEAQLEEGKDWDIRKSLIKLGNQLFTESFRLMSSDNISTITSRDAVESLKNELIKQQKQFEKIIIEKGRRAVEVIERSGLTVDHFSYKNSGVFNFFRKCSLFEWNGKLPEMNSYVIKVLNDSSGADWLSSEAKKDKAVKSILPELVQKDLYPLLGEIAEHINSQGIRFNSSRLILRHLDSLAVLGDLWHTIHKLSEEEGFLLLSDCAPLLHEFVKDTDTPFIYEKIGTQINHLMIDEFQDTSVIQWNNFKPLVANSLSQNGFSMVVGDIKQAIYRWRNGDWRILSTGLKDDFKEFGIESSELDVNRRSLPSVVHFNNKFFLKATEQIKRSLHGLTENQDQFVSSLQDQFVEAYSNILQTPFRSDDPKGYVEINLLPPADDYSYDDKLQELLPPLISDIQERGYSAGDIAILVRKNTDGQKIAKMLLSWKEVNPSAKGSFDIVSQDGLKLISSPSIQICIALFKLIYDPSDSISAANLVKLMKNLNLIECDDWDEVFSEKYVQSEIEWLKKYRSRSLHDTFEALVKRYKLKDNPKELAYISEIHELILSISRRSSGDLGRFITWWDENSDKLSISTSETKDALTIMTIHKAKGLEFPVVIVPYSGWDFKKNNSDAFLWVSNDQEPYSILPFFPIRHSQEMKNSFFVERWMEEEMQIIVDNLNLLYVAYTRPRNELYIFSEQVKEVKVPFSSSNALIQNTVEDIDSGVLISEEINHSKNLSFRKYTVGERSLGVVPTKPDHNHETLTMMTYPVGNIHGRIRQRFEASGFFEEEVKDSILRIRRGKVMHTLFSKIITIDDLENALHSMKVEGLIDEDQSCVIKYEIEQLLSKQPFTEWFSGKWKVRTEASILTPDGSIYRPDRVMTQNDKAVIVDYKFGKESESYSSQINRYAELIRQMGINTVECFLWYVDTEKLVKVQ